MHLFDVLTWSMSCMKDGVIINGVSLEIVVDRPKYIHRKILDFIDSGKSAETMCNS